MKLTFFWGKDRTVKREAMHKSQTTFGRVLKAGALLLCSTGVLATELQSVDYHVLPGDQLEIRLGYDQTPPQPAEFTTNNPARIALDFVGVSSGLKQKQTDVNVGNVRSITTVEAQDRTRVVLNLTRLVAYNSVVSGNEVIISLGAAASTASDSSAASAGAVSSGSHDIGDIDFRRGPDGEARIMVGLNKSNVNIDLRQQGRKVIADFIGADISEDMIRRLDVTDFGTPARVVETSRIGDKVRVAIQTSDDYEYLGYQADNLYTIELKPLTPEEKKAIEARKPQYTGDRLSLSFQDVSVRAVLQIIADFTGLNMVVSDSVDGNIALRLDNVPWDQALDIIMKTKGLDKRQNGNVILVAPTAELAAQEKLELEANKQTEDLAPMRTEFMQVNYAKAADIANLLKGSENSLLSERGNVSVDERTNTLLVQDTASKLEEVRDLVTTLDIPVRQVLIEARIVTADDGFSRDLGVKFGLSKTSDRTGIAGSLNGANILNQSIIVEGTEPEPGTIPLGSTDDRLAVNLPIVDAAGSLGLSVARLGDGLILDLELSALETENRGEVIASPRVITANQKLAYIEAGEEIPFQQSTSSGATSITFKKAVLSLAVTPQITPDGRVIMDLQVNQDTRGEDTPQGPAINTQELGTQVLVDNGETVVLGGIYQQRTNMSVRKVPLLGDIPGLGWLFRTRSRSDAKSELLIFVTPKIIDQRVQ